MLNIGCCASLIGAPVRGARALGREQGIELAGVLERRKLVESADVPLANVDLRHGAAAGPVHHLLAPARIEIDVDLLDLGEARLLPGPDPSAQGEYLLEAFLAQRRRGPARAVAGVAHDDHRLRLVLLELG